MRKDARLDPIFHYHFDLAGRIMQTVLKYLAMAGIFYFAGFVSHTFLESQNENVIETPHITLQKKDDTSLEFTTNELRSVTENLQNMLDSRELCIEDNKVSQVDSKPSTRQAVNNSRETSEYIQEENDAIYGDSQERYMALTATVDDQILLGDWTEENAVEFAQSSQNISHEQRSQLQLRIVKAINSGELVPENIHLPIF